VPAEPSAVSDLHAIRSKFSPPALPKRKGRSARRAMRANARPQGTVDITDPAIAERQRQCYDLRVLGFSFGQIAANLGVSVPTTVADVRAEAGRRTAQSRLSADDQRELIVAGFRKLMSNANVRIQKYESQLAAIDPTLRHRERSSLRKIILAESTGVRNAQNSIAKIEGVMPVIGPPVASAGDRLRDDFFDAMSEEQRLQIRTSARENRESNAMKQVGP
jgi:DNA-binding CsgD family transcriptional regulator